MIGTITQFITGDRLSERPSDNGPAATPIDTNGDSPGNGYVREDELVARLVEQLRENELPDEHQQLLREQLVADAPTSVDARLSHLQTKMSQLDAYTAALEAFIDEEGSADGVLEDVRDGMTQVNERIETLQQRIDDLDADRDTHRTEIRDLNEAVESLDEFVRSLKGQHGREIIGVDAKVDRLESRVDESIDALSTDIESNAAAVETIEDLGETIASHADDIEELRTLQDDVQDLQGLETTVQSLGEDIDRLVEFRRSFMEAISAPTTEASAN